MSVSVRPITALNRLSVNTPTHTADPGPTARWPRLRQVATGAGGGQPGSDARHGSGRSPRGASGRLTGRNAVRSRCAARARTSLEGNAMHEPKIPHLTATDPELAALIEGEVQRQHDKLRMIASENYVSTA